MQVEEDLKFTYCQGQPQNSRHLGVSAHARKPLPFCSICVAQDLVVVLLDFVLFSHSPLVVRAPEKARDLAARLFWRERSHFCRSSHLKRCIFLLRPPARLFGHFVVCAVCAKKLCPGVSLCFLGCPRESDEGTLPSSSVLC